MTSSITPFLQEKLIYIGQLDCYGRGSEIAKKLMGVNINDTAIYRLTDEMGAHFEDLVDEEGFRDMLQPEDESIIYAMADGSMINTKEDSWQEVKVGRVFEAKEAPKSNEKKKTELLKDEYVAHLGNHVDFEDKMSVLLDRYEKRKDRLVFISDGATWIRDWINAEYPTAKQILDFFHAIEKICKCVNLAKVEEKIRPKLIRKLSCVLKYNGIEDLRKDLNKLQYTTKAATAEKKKLDTYLDNNAYRMDYPQYLKQGLLIGSGAIESAHRTLIQKRMKLSGQRWTKRGAQNMINLRVIEMSGYWHKVTEKLRQAS